MFCFFNKKRLNTSFLLNFLAHQHLSFFNAEICVGNFSADFLRGKDLLEISSKIKKGIALHRKIDVFTDNHPLVKEALKILAKTQGRYASVILDVYFDFLLANNWECFSNVKLEVFNKKLYKIFRENLNMFPNKVQPAALSLITHDWFINYKNKYGMERSLSSIQRRVTFENNIHQAYNDMIRLRDKIEPLFLSFYPDLIFMSKRFFEENELIMR